MSDHTKIAPLPRLRRAPQCSNPMTSELASKAKTMVVQLGMAQHLVAAKLGVNPGRINDAVHGRIFPDAPFAPLLRHIKRGRPCAILAWGCHIQTGPLPRGAQGSPWRR